MARFVSVISIMISLALLAGCSSVIDKSTQEITIETPGANESFCYLDNGEVKYRANPPQPLIIANTHHPLEVRCLADGWREKTVHVKPETSDNFDFNALNLFAGAAVDYHTGAMYKYPEVVVVDFSFIEPQPAPLPNYQKTIDENPEIHNMEEFRSGWPALQSDRYEEIPEMKRRTYSEEQLQDRTLEVIDGAIPPDAPSGIDQVFGPDSQPGPEGLDALFGPESGAGADGDGDSGDSGGAGETAPTAESLTRKMNPAVFDGESESSAPVELSPQE